MLPFQLDEENVDETLRLRHRYLDLRRDRMRHNLETRFRLTQTIRRQMEEEGFWELETPILYKSTPEGAREFIVPARTHPGNFYALPQSPQTFKQLYVIAGYERYYQIARCFRDEATRADRTPEFTQLDIEVAFADREEIYGLIERLFARIWRDVRGEDLAIPFPRLAWEDAMLRYGSDKPDVRFGCEIADVTQVLAATEFKAFRGVVDSGGVVPGLCLPGRYRLLPQGLRRPGRVRQDAGAARASPGCRCQEAQIRSPIAKFLSEAEIEGIVATIGADDGDTIFLVADEKDAAVRVLGPLRLHLGERLGLIEEGWRFLWVTDFPAFEWVPDEKRWKAAHHPFTSPNLALNPQFEDDPAGAKALAYDLVLNGNEIGGGSVRIHDQDVQRRLFGVLGLSAEEAEEKFSFLLRALSMGAPPHAGIAFGLDRLAMLLAGAESLREVIAFPKGQGGFDPLTGAPSAVPTSALTEVGLRLINPPERPPGAPPQQP